MCSTSLHAKYPPTLKPKAAEKKTLSHLKYASLMLSSLIIKYPNATTHEFNFKHHFVHKHYNRGMQMFFVATFSCFPLMLSHCMKLCMLLQIQPAKLCDSQPLLSLYKHLLP